MLLAILFFLTDFIGPRLSAFLSCNSTRMGLAAITSFLISLFCGPFFITKLHQLKIGQSIRSAPDFLLGELHRQKQDTPTMGGILILFAMLISMFLWMDLTNVFTLILFITTCVLGALGGCDDYLKIKYKNSKGLSARKKMLIQLLLSLFIATYLLAPSASEILHIGHWFSPPTAYETIQRPLFFKTAIPLSEYSAQLYVPFLKTPLCSLTGWLTPLAAFFIFFVITGSSNAVNLTDGLDGLAAGCLIIVATCLAFVAFLSSNITTADYLKILYIEGTGEIAIYLSGFAGACLGFLWYNGHPAQVFMGDIGSLTLGGIIGVSAVLLKKEFLLAIIGGVFVLEALSVILQVASYRLRNKRRIFLCAPLHHHFEYKGWPETKVVLRFWILGLLLALLGLATLYTFHEIN